MSQDPHICLVCGRHVASLRELKVSPDQNNLLCPGCGASGGKMISTKDLEDLTYYCLTNPKIFYEAREERARLKVRPNDEARQLLQRIGQIQRSEGVLS
jgi:hypothetical protein